MTDLKNNKLKPGDEVLAQFEGNEYFLLGKMVEKLDRIENSIFDVKLLCVEFNTGAYGHAYRLNIWKLPEDKRKREAKLMLLKLEDKLRNM